MVPTAFEDGGVCLNATWQADATSFEIQFPSNIQTTPPGARAGPVAKARDEAKLHQAELRSGFFSPTRASRPTIVGQVRRSHTMMGTA